MNADSHRIQLPDLPIRASLTGIHDALSSHSTLMVSAPPGSGKTTLIPPALLDAAWLDGRRILVLEPRRLAARAGARRVATLLGERIGATVGYQVRLERHVGPNSRIVFLTEGLLARHLLSDPGLDNVGLVIFDEFHERSLHTDFAWALCRDMQRHLRPDLRLLVLSATLDAGGLTAALPHAAYIKATAPSYPVETLLLPRAATTPIWKQAAAAVRHALDKDMGDILVFLPGEAEINRTRSILETDNLPPGVVLHTLFGALSRERQDAALNPDPYGKRKIVLASAIAESSLTIEGVRIVIDAGWMRLARFSPHWGLSRLETQRITRDRADQRRGRAGRTSSGVCYRLWDSATDSRLRAFADPEILDCDLAPVALQAADWGARDPDDLPWITSPPDNAWQQARQLLANLDAIDQNGAITLIGRRMLSLSMHPRLAHMVLRAAEHGAAHRACLLAALIDELAGGALRNHGADMDNLSRALESDDTTPRISRHDDARRIHRLAHVWARSFPPDRKPCPEDGRLLSWAFPDRIARRIDLAKGRYALNSGIHAYVDPADSLCASPWIVAPHWQQTAKGIQVRLGAALDVESLFEDFGDAMRDSIDIAWDDDREAITAIRHLRLDSLVVEERPAPVPDNPLTRDLMLSVIRRRGMEALPWNETSRQLRYRILFLKNAMPDEGWPDVSDQSLSKHLDEWLGPFLDGVTRWTHCARIDLGAALLSMLSAKGRASLRTLAPTHITIPNGSLRKLRYDMGDVPVLEIRIQEAFGWHETPRVADGRIPVLLHLLSPAHRPVWITSDLAGFWTRGYAESRRELRGRYPRHAWPENPPAGTRQ